MAPRDVLHWIPFPTTTFIIDVEKDSRMQGPFIWMLDQDLESEAKRAFKVFYIRHRASVHVSGVFSSVHVSGVSGVFPCYRVLLPETLHRNYLEKWQSHCSEKVSETDFSKGVPKSRN